MHVIRILNVIGLAGMALGIGAILQPWWGGGFRAGFLATIVFTVLYIVTSHIGKPEAQ
jgi:hypothetical protein